MVRASAHALPHAAGFALLKPAEKPQLDAARIATMSGTIAVNLLAFGLLMMPLSMPPPALVDTPDYTPDLVWHKREQPKPEKVKIVEKTTPKPATKPVEQRAATQKPADADSSGIIANAGTDYVPPSDDDTGGGNVVDIGPATPSPMQLQYRLAPAPAYPRRALQQRLTGTVLLQVLVDVDGKPLEVSVARSSGHRELDEAARAQVLKRWSFQPATKNGLAVQAIGMVPVQFALQD